VRGLIVSSCLALAACRGLLGIDDPIVGAEDANVAIDAALDAVTCGTADWDMDGRPDNCDPCPMSSVADDDKDSDGDLIGDGCDPNPAKAGDQRVLFNGFADPMSIAQWLSTGSWSVVGGLLVQSNENVAGSISVPGTYGNVHVRVEAEYRVHGTMPSAGICAYVGQGYECCDVRAPTAPVLLAWTEMAMTQAPWNGSIAINTRFVLTEDARANGHVCNVSQGMGANSPLLVSSTHMPGRVVLHTANAAVAYRYVWIVQMAP
jgi:hypothetical protein